MKRIVIIITAITSVYTAHAQRRDTTAKTVVVTSAFKPSVKPAAKINFSAATPVTDSSRLNLQYTVPSQNLFFTYQPVPLKPLAVNIDTAINWRNDNYIKAGFGNYRTPFLQAGFSVGDGSNSVINLHTKHISSKGNLPFQQYSHSNADLIGIFNTAGNNEWRSTIGFDNRTQYRYGYKPDTLEFTKKDLLQRFTNFRGNIGIRNKQENVYGISYSPSVSVNMFGDNRSARELSAVLDAPITKSFGKAFAINLGFTADVTSLKTDTNGTIKNNLFYVTPSVQLKTPNVIFTGGFTPAWDNQVFSLLPNFSVVAKLQDQESLVLQAGWIGYFNKNTYQSLSLFNPWIQQPSALRNTRIREQYAGFKGSVGSHFTYNAKLSILNFSNAALFRNDTVHGNTFVTLFEPKMRALRIRPEIGYTVQEKFSLLGAVNINSYSGLKENERPWGLLPLEMTAAMRWQVLKDFHFKADAFYWRRSAYQTKTDVGKVKPAFDLNTGVEFTVMPKLNLWVQFNNIFNNKYQRWNQYEVLGFNVLGGIVYSFSQK